MEFNFCVYSEKKQRVDMFMSALFWELSRSYIQKLIDSGCVKVNGESVKKNLKISHKDEIYIQEIITSTELIWEDIPLDIIYEDENLCIVNKDAWINTHPTPGIEGKRGTLVNALLHHCKENLPVISGEERPGIVHRLDKDTSGAIIFAKNDITLHYLSDIIKSRKIKKYYIAIVAGIFTEKTFTIESEIGRDPNSRIKMTSKNPLNPKHARTHGKLLGYIDDTYSVLELELETGRTHQIRVHLASIGYPILGDSVYGEKDINEVVKKSYKITRQALHAYKLEFELYKKNQCFISPLKQDMKNMLQASESTKILELS